MKKKSTDYPTDTHRYKVVIPSREAIRLWIDQQGKPCSFDDIIQGLSLAGDIDKIEGIERRLRAMVRDGQLILNNAERYGLPDKMDLIRGRVIGHRDGFGFVAREDGEKDLFLGPRQMRKVLDGDKVLVRIAGKDYRGRDEATVISVIERKRECLVGKIVKHAGVEFFTPDDQRISQQFIVLPHPEIDVALHKNVEVEIISSASGRFHGQVKLIQVLGDANAPGMEVEVAIRTHGLPYEWSNEVKKLTKALGKEVKEADKQKRIDLRNLPLVTIDGIDARDFDDAVYCEPRSRGGYRLIVAIADVSHYVKQDSALDQEAYDRGTSVYFPDQVIPMLPEALSNGLCSLNPEVDRLCMVCEMTISAKGKISGYKFYEGVMRSHARLTYDQVGELLERPESQAANQVRTIIGDLEGHLINLYSLYHVLKIARTERGAIDFETPETYIIFDEYRKIEKIVPRVRNDAHKIIEECMLCANVATARLLEKYKLSGLFRNHEFPKEEKFEQLSYYLRSLGISVFSAKREEVTPKDYQQILEQIKDRPDFSVIQIRLLRSMNQALYQAENKGHFGLNYKQYAHFTSPIRRYPDLLVHRAIRWLIRSEQANNIKEVEPCDDVSSLPEQDWLLDQARLIAAGEHCSVTERRADEASREVEDKLKCQYMRQHLGAEFEGIVSGVTGFGLFVELNNIFIEGLIHVSSLTSDYYHYDEIQQTLTGERTHTMFGMGTQVKVKVAAVSVEDRKIDLQLIEAFGQPIRTIKKPLKKSIKKTTNKKTSGKLKVKKNTNQSKTKKVKSSVHHISTTDLSAKQKFDQEVKKHLSKPPSKVKGKMSKKKSTNITSGKYAKLNKKKR